MSARKRFDDLMEAITFAEAGEIDTARQLASEVFPEPSPTGRILTVSGARGFSPRMVEDSLGMAERLGYGLVALSVVPAMARLLAGLERRRRAREGWLTPDAYRSRASRRGIPFVHAAARGGAEVAVANAQLRFRRVAFLLVDEGMAAGARFAGVDVPIFYLADP